MIFYTWATDKTDVRLYELKESAKRHNIELKFLGEGITNWNHFMKISLLYNELKKLDDNEIVCAVDAFDVFFQDDVARIEQEFLNIKCDILFSAERGYSDQYQKYKAFYDNLKCDSPYRYLNSGVIIGYASALKKAFRENWYFKLLHLFDLYRYAGIGAKMVTSIFDRINSRNANESDFPGYFSRWYRCSDQTLLGRVYARNSGSISMKMDHATRLNWCTAFEWDDIEKHYKVDKGKLVNLYTMNIAPIIHVPFTKRHRDVFEQLFRTCCVDHHSS